MTQIILAALAAIALTGWVMAELDVRATQKRCDLAEWDLEMALGWAETQVSENAVVYPTLHSIDGGGS